MNRIEQHSLLISQLLILAIVVVTAWPVLVQPRIEDDDYRYLHLIQQVEAGKSGAVESMTIENRWDHLWFLNEEGRIRFFRPTVILSYAIDDILWSDSLARGLTVTNVSIHLLCCWLVGYILYRLLGGGLAAFSSSLLFAGLSAHSECIWYIAGRTDSLAALGFLGAFALHISGRRWWALPLFALGFLTKELVIVAPVLLACHDAWIAERRIDRRLYAAYGAAAAGVYAVKQIALAGVGSDFVHPYLIKPLSPEFPTHLWLQFRSYTGNLLAGEWTLPFADADLVARLHRPIYPIIVTLLFPLSAWILRKDKRFWLLVLLAVLTWLPTSFVYLSERYLYLPSVAFVGLLGVMLAAFSRRWRIPLTLLMLVYAAFHATTLRHRHSLLAKNAGSVQEMLSQVEPVRDAVQGADRLLLVNFPGHFVRAQFAQDIFRVVYDRPDLKVDVLTMMPGQNWTAWKPGDAWPVMGAGVQVIREDDRKIRLAGRVLAAGQPLHTIQEDSTPDFNWSQLSAGECYSTPTLEACVIQNSSAGATELSLTFFQSLEGAVVLVWSADCSDLNAHPWNRRKTATVHAQRL